jgi:hypothetical protein
MSLTSTVKQAVDLAFSAAGDLKVSATFISDVVTGYDFSTSSTVKTSSTKSVEIILVEEETELNSGLQTRAQALVRSEDIDLSLYTKFTVGAISYSIESFNQYEGLLDLKVRRL